MDHAIYNEGADGSKLHRRGPTTTTISANTAATTTLQSRQPQPRTILEEEEYTSTLTHIVTRDYYPSLHSLRRDAAILEARGRGDISEAVAIRRRFRSEEMQRERELMEEVQEENKNEDDDDGDGDWKSGTGGGSNDNEQCTSAHVRKRPRPLKHESITGFHARVTSEDNAEFELNQERERREREEFLRLVYDARADKSGRLMIENRLSHRKDVVDGEENGGRPQHEGDGNSASSRNHGLRALCDTPLGLSSDLYDAPPSAGLRITDGTRKNDACTRNGIGRNGLFFQPQHHRSVNPINSGQALRTTPSASGTFLALESNDSATETTTPANNDNRLMPPPPARLPSASSTLLPYQHQPSNEDSSKEHSAKSTPSIDHRYQLVEYIPKPTLPDIYPPATRFPYQNESRLLPNNNGSSSVYPTGNRQDSVDSFSTTDASDTTDLDASPAL